MSGYTNATTMLYFKLAACTASNTTITNDPWAQTTYEPVAAAPPLAPLDPPNYAEPRVLRMRQSDRAPCSAIAQVGFWLNAIGRRVA